MGAGRVEETTPNSPDSTTNDGELKIYCDVENLFGITPSKMWFDSKVAPEDDPDDGCFPDQAKALQDYCHKQTSAQAAALPDAEIPGIIQLLDTIQNLPKTNRFSWAGLPRFTQMWAEEHKQDHWGYTIFLEGSAKYDDQRTKHIRKANIEAQLAIANIGSIPLDWGYDCIANALERRDAIIDFEVPAAAQWIMVAGDRLHSGAVQGKESWALERKRDFQQWNAKMSLDRWSFWVKRMVELGGETEVVAKMTATP